MSILPSTMSESDKSLVANIARLITQALNDAKFDDNDAGLFGAARKIGYADCLRWDISDVQVRNRAGFLCDVAASAAREIDQLCADMGGAT